MRYYESKFPNVDEYVLVKIDTITEMGAYVSLLEYNNLEGLIQQTELSRRRVKSESKMARIGKTEVCVVLHVDKNKGFIDLSKRRVNTEEIVKVEDRFNKAKIVQAILTHVSELTDADLSALCKNISWPLYQKFGHAYTAFKLSLTDPDKAFEGIIFEGDIKKCLIKTINSRLQDKPVKIRADLEITCFGYEGIEGIKKCIREGESISTKDVQFKITLIAPPLYVILGYTTNPNLGIEILSKSIEMMKKKISEFDGRILVKANPRAVTAREDHSLNLLLEQLREQNLSDSDSEEEGESSEEEEIIGM